MVGESHSQICTPFAGGTSCHQPAVLLAPDRRTLQIVHADAEQLTTFDLASRTMRRLEVGPQQAWIERLLALTAQVAAAKASSEGATRAAVYAPDGSGL